MYGKRRNLWRKRAQQVAIEKKNGTSAGTDTFWFHLSKLERMVLRMVINRQ
jgi:hypothetical protein